MTEKRTARFDVRKYDERLPREQRAILSDTDNVAVTLIYPIDELPEQYKVGNAPDEFVRTYQSMAAREHNEPADRAAVKFKVGANCKWFDKYGHETKRPTNEWLESHDLEVQICYSRKERNAAKPTAPCGYWANGIMFREVGNTMFAGQAFETATEDEPEQETDTAAEPIQTATVQAAPETGDDDEELPF